MKVDILPIPKKTYTQDEAFQTALQYFKNDDLAARVWVNKYALKDSEGNIYESTPDDMHRRIAKEIARIELRYPNPLSEEDVFGLIKNFKYIVPQAARWQVLAIRFKLDHFQTVLS